MAHAIVDAADVVFLSQWRWYLGYGGYPCRGSDVRTGYHLQIRMHEVLHPCPRGLMTDHADGNKLNNQKSNLRYATPSENGANKRRKPGLKGVRRIYNRWAAYTSVGGKQKHLGMFKTAREAAIAYNDAAKERWGKFAVLNQIGAVDSVPSSLI